MNNIVEAVFGTCNPYECATRILYRYDYGMILTFPGLDLPTAYEVHFSNYDDVGTTITQIGNEDGVSIPDEFLQTGLPVYCWVYLHTGEDDGETVYKVTINVQDRPQPSNGTPTPVQQDAITEAIAALDSAVEQTGADASSANADALKSEGYAVGTQDGEPVEQGSPYYRHNSLWLSQQAGQSANKAEAQASLSEAWAVGEISGHPVPSDYPQYQNNSKYYAEQASKSAEDAEKSAQSVLGLTADATVDSNVGTPSVSVSVTTESDHKNMSFAFHNLKGVQGDTGVGISSVVLNADYTLTITLTNGTSYTTSSIRGEVGATPNLTIGTVSTLPEGSQATATITGTDEDPVLNLGIPVGDTGDPGISPTITVTEISGGHEVEVVDAEGTQTFDVMDGLDGQSGLITDYVAEEKTPYLFRPSANGLANVISEKDELIGGTVAWNQLWDETRIPSDSAIYSVSTYTANNVTFTKNGDGSITIQTTAEGASANTQIKIGNASTLGQLSFRNLICGAYGGSASTYCINHSSSDTYDAKFRDGISSGFNMWIMVRSGAIITTPVKIYPQIFNLDQMFGTTISSYLLTLGDTNGFAWFRKLFPKLVYPRNTGELMSVQTSAHVMRGFNQWDEEWEVGAYNGSNGAKVTTNDRIRSKNKIRVMPRVKYYFKNPSTVQLYAYDAYGNYLRQLWSTGGNTEFTVPNDVCYLTFNLGANSGTTYNHDICINLSGSKNGTYEPYSVHSYPLDSDLILRGVLELDASNNLHYNGDVYKCDGSVQRRYGTYTFDGTENWSRLSYTIDGVEQFYFRLSGSDFTSKVSNAHSEMMFTLDSPYDKSYKLTYWYSGAFVSDKRAWSVNNAIGMCIRDDAYSDTTTFKASLSGKHLVYELATPTTETADPYSEYQIVDADGTEEYVDERTVPIPVGHDTFYQQSVDVPQLPTTDGAYRLALSKTGNTATASWEYVAQAEMKAQANIPSGKYFSVGERLFVSTQAIAQGANIVVGTNCVETTLADALNTINS